MKSIRETVKSRGYSIGSWLNSASSIIAEIMSASGFDFLVIDAEHSAVDISKSLSLLQAIDAGNRECCPLVRTSSSSYHEIKRYLDAGAMGVIAPLVNTQEQAQEVVSAAKYPTEGMRGVGFGRSHGYGFAFEEYMAYANNKITVGIQIEHKKALENIDSILSVKGIEFVLIGPYDLSASMGITAQFNHPDYINARNTIMAKCKEHDILPGIHVVQPRPEEAISRIKEGFKVIGYSLDITMLGVGCREGLKSIAEQAR